jgi:two-component sensor histidine kinase
MTPEDYIGKSNRELGFDAEICEEWESQIQKTIDTGETQYSQFSLKDKEGRTRHFDWVMVPEWNDKGDVVTVLSLARDVTDRVSTQESLQRAVHDREVLIRDVHHRVKNNLFMLSGLLEMERQKLTERLDDPTPITESFKTVNQRIQVISSIYTYLYQSMGTAQSVQANSYVEGLAELLRSAYSDRPVELAVRADGVSLEVDTAIALGLVVNEAIANAYKYAFPKGKEGSINIELRKQDGQVALIVSDDGVGMDASEAKESPGLGLTLIDMLSQQLGGSLDIDGVEGTTIRLDFPAATEFDPRSNDG